MRRALLGSILGVLALTACNDDPVAVVEAPAPPRALEGSYYAGAVTLTWELAAGWDGESFRVYGRRVSDADYFYIAEVTSCTSGVCFYTDANIEEDVTYEYYVSAWDAASGLETASDVSVQVVSPLRTPPPVPNQTRVIALDDANYIVWGSASRNAQDFSFYRVYQAAADGNDYLLGETDSDGFLDLLAGNGLTYEYFVTAVDVDGHESAASSLAQGTPRPDFTAELLYNYHDVPEESGFRFQEDASVSPVLHGDDVDAHFSVERDVDGVWWLVPSVDTETGLYQGGGTFTTTLKCGVAADPECVGVEEAPLDDDYLPLPLELEAEHAYFLRVYGDDGEARYGVIRVALLDVEGGPDLGIVLDWAYQLQPGNPALSPARPDVADGIALTGSN